MNRDNFPEIDNAALLADLAQGASAGLTVVTPNRRLAAALADDLASAQVARGLGAWEAPDILPLSAFVERLHEDALYSGRAGRLPLPLSGAQEQVLWEAVIAASDSGKALLSVPPAAALAREAWSLAHGWRLPPAVDAGAAGARANENCANEDGRAFAEWAWRYEGITRRDGHTDRARLPDVVRAHLGDPAVGSAMRVPQRLVAYGFDILSAQQRDLFAALAAAGAALHACGPRPRMASARRVACLSAREEIEAAARWARARLEAATSEGGEGGERGAPRRKPAIGVVIPNLGRARHAVRRIFTQVMDPARPLSAAQRVLTARPAEARPGSDVLPFNISLGEPLTAYPLVAAALLLLEAAHRDIEFAQASRVIRSPFMAGAETELAQRATLDAALRRNSAPKLGVESLRRAVAAATDEANRYRVPACPVLSRRLADFAAYAREQVHGPARSPGEWGKVMSGLLETVGFPGSDSNGGRALDSAEYQTLKKFHDCMAGFAALDRVASRMRFREACAHLRRIAADTLFQPEAADVPIHILGVLESAGLAFDHLWVMGLHDQAWPIPARPNPFIPVALQREAGVPEASAAASLELDARITAGWLAAADEVVLSHPLREDDRELLPSPLIRALPGTALADLGLPEYDSLRAVLHRARAEERPVDARGPAYRAQPGLAAAGGTSLYRDQAACPFRAFTTHRLDARALDSPAAGLSASDRGSLLHSLLANVWSELKTKSALASLPHDGLDALLGAAADRAIRRLRHARPDVLEGRYAELERARLVKIGHDWLTLEKARDDFEVVAIEDKRTVSFGGITVNARLDRMDRLASGGYAILDYKSGAANVGDWLGPRPAEPQLPLYALDPGKDAATSDRADIRAVAFARVKAGEMEFKGIARDPGLIPGVKTVGEQRVRGARAYRSWEELLGGWRNELETLGREFAGGEARVDPKRGDETCRYCELRPLCRINERGGAPDAEAVE
jgi:ATP-dependent helicase/nuclease subunit B